MKRLFFILCLWFLPTLVMAQAPVGGNNPVGGGIKFTGPTTPGDCVSIFSRGFLQDAGIPCVGASGVFSTVTVNGASPVPFNGLSFPNSTAFSNTSGLGLFENGINIIAYTPPTPTYDEGYQAGFPGRTSLLRSSGNWQQLGNVFQQVSTNDQISPDNTGGYVEVKPGWSTGDVASVIYGWATDYLGPSGTTTISCRVNQDLGDGIPNCNLNALQITMGASAYPTCYQFPSGPTTGTGANVVLAGLSFQTDRARATGNNVAASNAMLGRLFFDAQDAPCNNLFGTIGSGNYGLQYLTTRTVAPGLTIAGGGTHPSLIVGALPTSTLLDSAGGIIMIREYPGAVGNNMVGDLLQVFGGIGANGQQAWGLFPFIDNATLGAARVDWQYGQLVALSVGNGISLDGEPTSGAGTLRLPSVGGEIYFGAQATLGANGAIINVPAVVSPTSSLSITPGTGATPSTTINASGSATTVNLTLNSKGASSGINLEVTGTPIEILTAAGVQFPVIPTSAGSGGLYLCVDNTGVQYKKASCP